jgi:uncharacterized membrane protein YidH (DUF202 family)
MPKISLESSLKPNGIIDERIRESADDTVAAWMRTRTWFRFGIGFGISATFRTSGGP